jgi:hypothetical protein
MDVENIENVRLWLPSDIPVNARHKVSPPVLPQIAETDEFQVCSEMAIRAELSLMLAELHDNLVSVRKYRRAYCILAQHYLGAYKPGSGMGTRKRSEMTQAGERIEAARLRYQHAWHAADALSPGGTWSSRFKWLEKKDIRGPNPGDDLTDLAAVRKPRARDQHVGRYEQSWIWTSVHANDEPDESVRVQWSKMNATATRWAEEMVLVVEEMRRTLASFENEAVEWDARVGCRAGTVPDFLAHALDGYASRQARLWRRRVLVFARKWLPLLQRHNLGSVWLPQYVAAVQADDVAAKLRTRVPSPSTIPRPGLIVPCPAPGIPHSSLATENTSFLPSVSVQATRPYLTFSHPASLPLVQQPSSFAPASYHCGHTQPNGTALTASETLVIVQTVC